MRGKKRSSGRQCRGEDMYGFLKLFNIKTEMIV